MQLFLRTVALALPLVLTHATARANDEDTAPVLEAAPVERVYVPQGFDDNDNVEISVAGRFLGTCYKTGPIEAKANPETQTIDVTVKTYHYRDERCGKRLVSFIQTAKLGPIKSGTYKIRVNSTEIPSTQQLLVTRAARATADDYIYAPVETVQVDETSPGKPKLILSGRYPYSTDDCMILQEVKTSVTPDQVLVVQPIVGFATGPQCASWFGRKSFHYTVDLSQALRGKTFLAHVRVMNGNSINTLVSF